MHYGSVMIITSAKVDFDFVLVEVCALWMNF